MRTSAENRRVLALLSGIQSSAIVPRPDFQRKLVWSNGDKVAFLETVLGGYPFPEIYIAVGTVDLETAVATEVLVDGQQRVTTLFQYFTASQAIRIPPTITPYAELSPERKTAFLNYEVAVRNLGIIDEITIQEVFRRINSTAYSLNAMEIHNARYRGPLKQCADDIAQNPFFDAHKLFSAREIRRMRDVVYCLTIIISMMSQYFNRDDEIENFLEEFNDAFPEDADIRHRFKVTKAFIEQCAFPDRSRAWKKTDFLVLFVELDRLLNKERVILDSAKVGPAVEGWYDLVDAEMSVPSGDPDLQAYFKSTVQATNDRSSRVNRGRSIRSIIRSTVP